MKLLSFLRRTEPESAVTVAEPVKRQEPKLMERGRGGRRMVRSGGGMPYAGAASDHLTMGLTVVNNVPDYEVFASAATLRARARQFERDSEYGRRFFNLVSRNVVGPQGIRLQVRSLQNNGQLDRLDNDLIEGAWKEWGKAGSCTVDGRLSWRDLLNLVARSWLRDGEIFLRMVRGADAGNRFGFALQLIEADLIDDQLNRDLPDGRQIRMGIEMDRWQRPQAYWVLKGSRPALAFAQLGYQVGGAGADHERVPASDMIHVYKPDRAGQSRGVSAVAVTTRSLHMLDGYSEAELVASRVAANKMGFFVTPDGDGAALSDGETEEGVLFQDSQPGEFPVVGTGYDLRSWDPQHPNQSFADFVKAMLRTIAAGLDVSYVSLANDLEGVNYSSIRQGALDERDAWRCLQAWLVEHVCGPVYTAWLPVAIASGALNLPIGRLSKWERVAWFPRGWQWVDPQKEVDAAAKAIDYRLTSRQEVTAQHGRDWHETIEAISDEQSLAYAAGVSLPEDEREGVDASEPMDEELPEAAE